MNLVRMLGLAIRLWWREFLFLLLLNFLWLLAQVTIVFGPPATAALAAVAARVVDGELVDFDDFARSLRADFGVAWLWGLAQLAVYAVLGYNLVSYHNSGNLLLTTLRYAWALMMLAWFALNLYFWPLYHRQSDRRFMTTLANAGKMALLNPVFTVAYALLALALIAVSIASGLLLGAVLAAWLSVWGAVIVQVLLEKQ